MVEWCWMAGKLLTAGFGGAYVGFGGGAYVGFGVGTYVGFGGA